MPAGRPPEYDPEYLMQEMICWARLPDSLNINSFCHSVRPEIDPEYLRELVHKSPEFSRVYRIVKSYLATRREEANSEKILSNQAYASGLRHYDLFLKEEWKDELRFEKGLEKESQTEQVKEIEGKFSDVLDQLKGLSKRKIEERRTSNEQKS